MTAEQPTVHVPVMADEVVQMLAPAAGSRRSVASRLRIFARLFPFEPRPKK